MRVKFRDFEFEIDEGLHPEFWSIAVEKNWEFGTFDIIDSFVSDGDIVVDIGCWIGPFSIYLASKGAMTYSLDPDPIAYQALLKNLKLNPIISEKVVPANIAISQSTENFKIHARTAYGNSSTSLLKRIHDNLEIGDVKGMRLDDFFKSQEIDHIKLLKIDIEGGEFAIANQLAELKRQKKFDHLVLSLHYGHLNESIYERKFPFRKLSKIFMRLEQFFSRYLFRSELLNYLEPISDLCKEFDFAYSLEKEELKVANISPSYLLNRKIDIFLTDNKWTV